MLRAKARSLIIDQASSHSRRSATSAANIARAFGYLPPKRSRLGAFDRHIHTKRPLVPITLAAWRNLNAVGARNARLCDTVVSLHIVVVVNLFTRRIKNSSAGTNFFVDFS